MGMLRVITVKYSDGSEQTTNCAGDRTEDEVRQYYIGQDFNHGERFEGDPSRLVKAVAVEFKGFMMTCPHCGMGQLPEVRPDRKCNIPCCGKRLDG